VRLSLVAAGLVVLAACSGERQPGPAGAAGQAAATAGPEAEARLLGPEIYDLVDRAMSYRSSHRGRPPRSLRELGEDELTPATRRTLSAQGREPVVTVEFRNLDQRTLKSCTGTSQVLEEASLSGGEFTVTCATTTGASTTLRTRR